MNIKTFKKHGNINEKSKNSYDYKYSSEPFISC